MTIARTMKLGLSICCSSARMDAVAVRARLLLQGSGGD